MTPVILKTQAGSQFEIQADGFSFYRVKVAPNAGPLAGLSATAPTAPASTGVRGFALRLTTPQGAFVASYTPAPAAGTDRIGAQAVFAGCALTAKASFRLLPTADALLIEHTLVNTGTAPVSLCDAALGQFQPSAGVLVDRLPGWDLRFVHTDNVRSERFPYCQGESPYVRNLPTFPVTIGAGEDQPFPAILFTEKGYGRGVVFGAATQRLAYQVWDFSRAPVPSTSIFEAFAMRHDWGQAASLTIPPGGTLVLDATYIEIQEKTHPQCAFDAYLDHVSSTHTLRGATTPLLSQAMHCTWNYGVFSDQRAEPLLKTARFIAGNLPNIKFFLMDAGYLEGCGGLTFLHNFYPEANQHVTKATFPNGIRGYTDELRRLGLRPGIWWSPTAGTKSKLFTDHPDWFLKKRDGSTYLIGENGYLDFSNPEAAAFVDRTLAVVLGEWGMDALKMDFWSQNFEDRDACLARPGLTAVQTRTILFDIIRKHLPPDGVFMTCVATGMGNPFIGQHADTYRNTIDIGEGRWAEQINNCLWALPTVTFPGRKSFLLNGDSVGFNPQAPDHENRFRLTWGYITMGMIETGGRFEERTAAEIAAMRKLTDRCDQGYKVQCPDERAFTGEPYPEVLTVNFPAGSPTHAAGVRQSIALFNWTDEPRIVAVRRARLGHDGAVRLRDFWTGETESLEGEFLVKRLAGRSALLFDVIP